MTAEEKVIIIKSILKEINATSDSQEFGLSYGQAINCLSEIEEIIEI